MMERPSHWHTILLSDLVLDDRKGDWGKEFKKYLNTSIWAPVRVIRATDLSDWHIHKGEYATVRAIEKFSLQDRKPSKGDILIEIAGGSVEQRVGRTVLIDDESVNKNLKPLFYSNFFRLLRTDSNVINPEFLQKYLEYSYNNNLFDDYQKLSNNLRNLSFTKLKESFYIPLPPLQEQAAIVNKLRSLENHLALAKKRLSRVPRYIEKFRQSILQSAVLGEILEETSSDKSAWQTIKSDSIFQYITSGPRSWSNYYSEEGALFLRIGNMSRNSLDLDLSNVIKVRLPQDVEGTRTALQEGDVLISITGELIMKSVVPAGIPEAYVNQHIALARPKSSFYPKYIGYALMSDYCHNQLLNKQSGTTRAGLSLDDIRNIDIPIPPYKEQIEIVRRVEELFSIADKLQDQYEKAVESFSQLEASILHQAFNSTEFVQSYPQDTTVEQHIEAVRKKREALKSVQEKTKKVKRAKIKLLSFMKASEHTNIKAHIKNVALSDYGAKDLLSQEDIDELRHKIGSVVKDFDYDDFAILFQELAQESISSKDEEPFFIAEAKEGKIHYKLNK